MGLVESIWWVAAVAVTVATIAFLVATAIVASAKATRTRFREFARRHPAVPTRPENANGDIR